MPREQLYEGVIGMEIKPDDRPAYIDDGLIAFPERLVEARKYWPESRAEDFEKLDRRRYRDLATGRVYRRVNGCPLLAPTVEEVDVWFIQGGKFVFLINDARHETERTVVHGEIFGGQIINGQIIREGS